MLEALGPQHNERDHQAWTSSIDHIRSTPGFPTEAPDDWPRPMSSERNLQDLHMHADEFAAGVAYAYSVLDPTTDDVIGCVYIDPDEPAIDASGRPMATMRSWVRSDRAELDEPLATTVTEWLRSSGAFGEVRTPGRQ